MHFILHCRAHRQVPRNPGLLLFSYLPLTPAGLSPQPTQGHLSPFRLKMAFTWLPLLFPRPIMGFLLFIPFLVAATHILQVLKHLMKLRALSFPAQVEGKAGLVTR